MHMHMHMPMHMPMPMHMHMHVHMPMPVAWISCQKGSAARMSSRPGPKRLAHANTAPG